MASIGKDTPQTQYVSYLMRLWRPGTMSAWHIQLEHVGTGEKLSFADLDALNTFLQTRMRGGESVVTIPYTTDPVPERH